MILTLFLILAANVLSSVFIHWLFRNVGFVICGLLLAVHPVLPEGVEPSENAVRWTRVGGGILILIGIFTRSYIY